MSSAQDTSINEISDNLFSFHTSLPDDLPDGEALLTVRKRHYEGNKLESFLLHVEDDLSRTHQIEYGDGRFYLEQAEIIAPSEEASREEVETWMPGEMNLSPWEESREELGTVCQSALEKTEEEVEDRFDQPVYISSEREDLVMKEVLEDQYGSVVCRPKYLSGRRDDNHVLRVLHADNDMRQRITQLLEFTS